MAETMGIPDFELVHRAVVAQSLGDRPTPDHWSLVWETLDVENTVISFREVRCDDPARQRETAAQLDQEEKSVRYYSAFFPGMGVSCKNNSPYSMANAVL